LGSAWLVSRWLSANPIPVPEALPRYSSCVRAEFLEWLRSTDSSGDPDALLNAYRARLRAIGVPVFDIEDRLAAVTNLMNDDPESWRWLFNRVYASSDYSNMRPNDFLARMADRFSVGCALDVCIGQGRNSLYLAGRGWHVTGFDVAEQGLTLARASGRHASGLHLLQSTEEEFCYGTDLWDLILVLYAPVALTDGRFVAKIRDALRPGGAIVIESFAYDLRVGQTRLGALEIDPRELLRAFQGFSIIAYEEVSIVPDWGTSLAGVVRMCAQVTKE
jgi:SAM-dependent methyltransferase